MGADPVRQITRKLRGSVASKLTPSQKATLWRLRHGEETWQRNVKDMLYTISGNRNEAVGIRSSIVAHAYDARKHLSDTLETISTALSVAGTEYIELPRRSAFSPVIAISEHDSAKAFSAVMGIKQRDAAWVVRLEDANENPLTTEKFAKRPDKLARIVCYKRAVAENGREMTTIASYICIEPWSVLGLGVERVDGGDYPEGTLLRKFEHPRTLVEYFTPNEWKKHISTHRVLMENPLIFKIDEPIDLVYTWVDGEDPTWLRKKSMYLPQSEREDFNETAFHAARFKSRDELRYSLRSVEYYANWVNHIYLVTDDQVPEWLDTDNPKITVVSHREIFANSSDLPVFNSHAIESQLHRIPGLSEKYIYMNDDIFFLRPVDPELFFTGNGLARFFVSTAPIDFSPLSSSDMPVLSAAKNNRLLISERFGKTVVNKFKHTPHPQLKSVIQQMEEENPELFAKVASSRFRHPDDYSITSSLHHYFAYCIGRAIDASLKYAYCDLGRPDLEPYLVRTALRKDVDLMCVNDTKDTNYLDDETKDQLVGDFLRRLFPVPSSFERMG